MAKKIDEQKIVDALVEVTNNHWFNPALAAQLLVKHPIYTQDAVMELIKEIIRVQSLRYENDIQHDETSEGLIWAARLNETLELYEPIE